MNEFEQLVTSVTKKVMEQLVQGPNDGGKLKEIHVLGNVTTQLIRELTAEGYQIVDETNGSLYLAELSVGRLARIALMTPKDSEEELILGHLLAKREVFVNISGKNYSSALKRCPYAMKSKINQYEVEWQRYGAHFIRTQSDIKKKRVLDACQLQDMTKMGEKHITISKDTIITPLAKDVIRDYQLTLIKE